MLFFMFQYLFWKNRLEKEEHGAEIISANIAN